MFSQDVTLTCNDHHYTLLRIFEKFLEKSRMVDCTLRVEGEQLKVHKEVLSAFSPFFQLLFEEENEDNTTVVLSGFTYKDVNDLIDYMYCGWIQISQDRVENLIDTARSLQIEGIGDIQDKNISGSKSAQSNAISSPVNAPCGLHKQRENINGKQTASSSTVRTDMDIENQEPSACELQITGVRSITHSTFSHVSSVNSESTGSNLPLFSHQQSIISFPNNNKNNVKSIDRNCPSTNGHMFNKEKELHILLKMGGEEDRNVSVCQLGRNSFKNDDGDAILGLTTETKITKGHNLCESPPVVGNFSYISSVASADIPSEVVKPSCSRVPMYASPQGNERSRDINIATSDIPIVPSGEVEDEMFTSELILKTEPISQFETLSEGIETEPDEMRVLGGERENEHKEVTSIQNPGAIPKYIKEVPTEWCLVTSNLSDGFCISKSTNRRKSSSDAPWMRSHSFAPSDVERSRALVSQDTSKKSHGVKRKHKGTIIKYSERPCETKLTSQPKRQGRIHKVVNRFKCVECEYSSGDLSNFNARKCIHKGNNIFKCALCSYVTKTKVTLRHHIRKHMKPYKCLECDYATVCSGNLKLHMCSHTGEKPSKCSECDYAPENSAHLKRHMRIHNAKKPYLCSKCNYATARSLFLKLHMRFHTGAKPYKCSKCDYETGWSGNLNLHMSIHTRKTLQVFRMR